MGVHGLWQLLHPSGRPVTLESLEGKVLAVDVSIWLHQAMKGMRDKDGNPLPNAHLQGLFSRVCKLLFYRIKPVFVFDGGIPALKKQTLAARRERKSEAQRERDEIGQKLLRNLIKSQAVKQALGGGSGSAPVRIPGVRRKGGEDIFELPPLPEAEEMGLAFNSEAWESEFEQQENWVREGLATLSKVDPDSEEFKSLPMEIQHEALVDLKEERKFHSLSRISKMPEDADSFSAYQLKKLMKVSNLTTRIDDVRKQMSNKISTEVRYELGDDYYGDEVEAKRIVSEDASHYVLIKGMSKEKQKEEAEKYDLLTRVKTEKEENLDEASSSKSKLDTKENQRNTSIVTKKLENNRFSGKRQNPGKSSEFVSVRKGSKGNRNDSSHTGGKTQFKRLQMLQQPVNDDVEDIEDNADGNDESVAVIDDGSSSSSEDEGFIEVSFDPNQIAKEDDLFPASIFATTSTVENDTAQDTIMSPLQNLVSQNTSQREDVELKESEKKQGDDKEAKTKKRKKNERKFDGNDDDSVKPSEVQVPIGVETDGIIPVTGEMEKRKNVLSDILLELQKKKEELGSLTADNELLGVKMAVRSDDDNDTNDDGKGEKDGEMEVMEDKVLPGGFLRDESDFDEDDDGSGDVCHSRLIHNAGNDYHKMRQEKSKDDGDFSKKEYVMTSFDDRMNESEDEDLRLAIELSLQTAKAENDVVKNSGSKQMPEVRENEGTDGQKTAKVGEIRTQQNDDLDEKNEDDDDDGDDFEMVESLMDEKEEGILHKKAVGYSSVDNVDMESTNLTDDEEEDVSNDEGSEMSGSTNGGDNDRDGAECHKIGSVTVSPSEEGTERLQPEDVDDPFYSFSQSNLENIQDALDSERTTLLSEHGKQDRFASSLTDQIVLEAQELLSLFGIPFVVSPMEAEAQCAFLDATQQTQGTITDDSDIWLFGGSRVYKNFFNQSKYVELFSMDSIKSHFGLNRQQLIKIALLCGSDYTVGIQGVGPVRALEIMAEFHGDGLKGLKAFRHWWNKSQKTPIPPNENKLRTRLRDLNLNAGFPSQAVMEAYLVPAVDESRENFSWGHPNLDLLKHFAKMKFGWSRDRYDSVLDPMMKQLMKRQTQGRIHSYFQPKTFIPAPTNQSDRLKKALSIVQRKLKSDSAKEMEENENADDSNDDDHHNENEDDEESEMMRRGIGKERVRKAQRVGELSKNKSGESGLKGKKNGSAMINKRKASRGESKKGGNLTVRFEDAEEGKNEKKKAVRKTSVKGRKRKHQEENDGEKNETKVKYLSKQQSDEEYDAEKVIKIEKEVVVKREKGMEDDGGDESFMKQMQEKVAKASSNLDLTNTGKRGGRGRGRRAVCKKENVCKVPSLPSLEVNSRRGGRGKFGGRGNFGGRQYSSKGVLSRGVVCLSESSSSSDDNDDGDSCKEIKFVSGLEFHTEVRSQVGPASLELSRRNEKEFSATLKKQEKVSKRSSQKKTNPPSISEVCKSKKQKLEKDVDKYKHLKSQQSSSAVSLSSSAAAAKVIVASSLSSSSSSSSSPSKYAATKPEVSSTVSSLSSSSSVMQQKREFYEMESDGSNSKKPGEENPLEGEEKTEDVTKRIADEGGDEKIKSVVGQVPGKNPDVSLINAQTLKATLSYLNQRSMGEKHLLNVLRGKRPANAVELRMEEEDRKSKRLSFDSGKKKPTSKNSDGVRSQSELSFEDMLGGSEIFPSSKSKSAVVKKNKNVKKKESKTSVATKQNKESSIDSEHRVGNRQDQIRTVQKPAGRQSRERMKSFSDDSGTEGSSIVEKKDHIVGQRTEIEEKDTMDSKFSRSKKSQAFDTPIRDRQEKFRLQLQHFADSQSVKGHGIFPSQKSGSVRGRAIAGKGKGIGKNRSGRQQGLSSGRTEKKKDGSVVTGVLASSGVTDADIVEYGGVTLDDLGSDFSDDGF